LSTRFGSTLTQSALWTAVTVLGIWIFGQFADRIGRRPALFTLQAGALIMVLVYSQLTDAAALLIGGASMGVFVNGMLSGYGGFGPFVVGALAATYSFAVAIALLATIYLLDIVATAFLIPEKKGAALE
jgi:hypothetical protein